MEYPHQRYLKYLLSRRLNDVEVVAACKSRSLVSPGEDDLRALRRELEPFPSAWRSELSPRNSSLYRWLRDHEIVGLWRRDSDAVAATDFLYATDGNRGPRPDFEHLLLLEWDVPKAREQLALKYGELRIPSREALAVYAHFFWNLPNMSSSGVFNFLDVQDENSSQLMAYAGDVAATYGILGLRHRVEDEEFYDNVIALANEQVQIARASGGGLNGQQIMGIAALARVADDAIQQRREIRKASLGDTVRNELAAFRLRKKQQRRRIPSYEDLVVEEAEDGNVIDVTGRLVEQA